LLTPFYYDETSSLMNLSASPSSAMGGNIGHHSGYHIINGGNGFRTSNLTAKGAIAQYDRIISSTKSARS
jgi:hypothetical protein